MAVADVEIARAALAGGWPRNRVATAVAVALAESGGNATATNRNDNGTTDYGLWQINSIHKADLASGNWSTPTDNARMAYAVYKRAGMSFRPWYAYRDNKHMKFMQRGQKAAIDAGAVDNDNPWIPDVIEDATDAVGNATDAAQGMYRQATRALGVVTDRDTWVRAGMLVLGGFILVVAVAMIATSMNTGKIKAVAGMLSPTGKVAKVAKIAGKVKPSE